MPTRALTALVLLISGRGAVVPLAAEAGALVLVLLAALLALRQGAADEATG